MNEGREGYKKTKLGWIPNQWNVDQLFNICNKITDGSHFSPVPINEDYLIGNVKDMMNSDFNYDTCTNISKDDFQTLKKNGCSPEIGDVLFSKDGTIGRTFVFNNKKEIVLLSSIAIIRTNKDFLNAYYLMQVLLSDIFYKQIEGLKSGSALKRIVLKAIKEIKVPLPPLKEQQKIASILSTVDEKLESIDKRIEETEKLKKGLMQTLLTKGIGHTKFKDSKIGRIPKGWEVISLENMIDKGIIIKHLDGNHGELYPKSKEFVKAGIPYIGANSIVSRKVALAHAKYLTKERASVFVKGVARNGDVLFAHNATVGPVAVLDLPFEFVILSTTLTFYRCNHELIDNHFLANYMESSAFVYQYLPLMKQTTRNQLPITMQRKLFFVLPDINEQRKLASILSTADDKLNLLQEKKGLFNTLKKGLMQQLLTGQIRVKL
jgi:type I restriction enzyme, S subunit